MRILQLGSTGWAMVSQSWRGCSSIPDARSPDSPAFSDLLPFADSYSSANRPFSNDFATVAPRHTSVLTLALSSIVAAGVQFGWALQLSLLTPYIQTLGIEHDSASFIWLCGPITGLVVQPCVGVWSDKCTLRLGRRRPFILGGTLLICLAATIIGFAADIGYFLGDSHKNCKLYQLKRPRAAGVFIFGFWLLDLANNTVQGPARALLADLAGPEQRDTANAIFSLWMAIGNIIGFSTGASGSWHKKFSFVITQACCEACGNLKAAFLVAVVFLLLCTLITVYFAKETPLVSKPGGVEDASLLHFNEQEKLVELQGVRIPVEIGHDTQTDANGRVDSQQPLHHENGVDISMEAGAVLVNRLASIRKLPSEMKSVLMVMALCWLSWFPFFLYDTDWMGREVFHGDPSGDADKINAYHQGVLIGAFGLLLNSIILAVGSFFINPLCKWLGQRRVWAISNFTIFLGMGSTALISALAGSRGEHAYDSWAVAIIAILGLPLAVTYSVPYSITAELASGSGGGQGLAMAVLNLAVVIPQMIVALGAGKWDKLLGGGNEPAFGFAALFAFTAGVVAWLKLPELSKGYHRPAGGVHGFG